MVAVGFVLGKPPRRSPVLSELVTRLRSGGARVSVHVNDGSILLWLSEVDLVAHRGVSTRTLELLVAADGQLPILAAFRRAHAGTTWRQESAGPWEALALRATDALGQTVAGVDVLQGCLPDRRQLR